MKTITYRIDDIMLTMIACELDAVIQAMLEDKLIFDITVERVSGEHYSLYRVKHLDVKDEVCRFEL